MQGNDKADKEAKAAAKGHTSEEWYIPIKLRGILPVSRTVEIQRYNKELKEKAKAVFTKSPRAVLALNIDPTMPSPAFMKLISQLPQRHTSLLIQLITGHIALNRHLARMGKAESPACPACGRYSEMVHHFLFRGRAHDEHRKILDHSLKRHGKSSKTLLACLKALSVLFKYISATKHFKGTHGSIELPEEDK